MWADGRMSAFVRSRGGIYVFRKSACMFFPSILVCAHTYGTCECNVWFLSDGCVCRSGAG